MREINRVAVIGAGVMGSGIAAQLANAGVEVVLLDRVSEQGARSALATEAIKRLNKTKPAPLMHRRNGRLITPGNLEDDLESISGCDWIVEGVIEDLEIKQSIYRLVDGVRKPGSIVSSNTSTIPLGHLVKGLSSQFAADFLITHFFNPPRYMRLLEVVQGEETEDEVIESITAFCDFRLGKGVVHCKDTPGFIANRIGTLWLESAMRHAFEGGLSVEEADAVIGRPMGFPKTGVFGLLDLVGIDLGPHIARSLLATLPPNDRYRDLHVEFDLVTRMISEGYTGRKGKGGFYRLNRSGGGKVKEAIDLKTGEYHRANRVDLESVRAGRKGLRALVEHPDRGGRYGWKVLADTLSYAASLIPEIADSPTEIDQAMRLGYNWKWGPFELIDKLGPAWFASKLEQEGMAVPPWLRAVGEGSFYQTSEGRLDVYHPERGYCHLERAEGVILLADIKLARKPVSANRSASLWDLEDGVLCLEFHSKMNTLDEGTFAQFSRASELITDGPFKALVIYNEGSNFSVGANIGIPLFAANLALWSSIEESVKMGQECYKELKYAPFPVVGAPSGMALGGGCELLLHCDFVQAHAESYIGLVEVGVGVVPGWGGCKEMITRWVHHPKVAGGPMPPVSKVFETVGMATVATSAEEARDVLFLRAEASGITMNRDRLLADAKAKAVALAGEYAPPEPLEVSLPGASGRGALKMAVDALYKAGKVLEHDVVVGEALAWVLCGGDSDVTETLDEDDLLRLEREAFMSLIHHPKTLARVEHMLETGKPLRN